MPRKKIMGVYKITSPSNRIYVGSSVDIRNRMCTYRNCKAFGQKRLQASLLKYGFDKHKFEIICECSLKDLYKLERYYGEIYNAIDKYKGLNIRLPKAGEEKELMTEDLRHKMSKTFKGRKMSEEAKKKMSIAKKGKKSPAGKEKLVLNMQNGVFHDSITEAAKTYGYVRSSLTCKLHLWSNYKNNSSNLCLV